MRFAPYLAEISFAFSKTPSPFTEIALNWSNDGLETTAPSHVEYTSPQSGATLPLFFENTNPILRLANLPESQALKGALNVAFSNGDVLEDVFIDYLFVAFLTRLTFKYIPHEEDTSEKLHFAAKISWQIDPLLINRVDYYTIQSAKIIENQIHEIHSETEIVIHSMEPGDTIPITLAAIGFDGSTLGSVSLTLYAPLLKIIPTRTHIDGVGYGKQIDSSGIQETYQVNHHKTIAQMKLPTQQHAAETKSLGKPLSLLNPVSVKSSDAREYVIGFDPNEHNTPFDYSAAKETGANIAPQATASFNENHLGNYTLNHQVSDVN